MRKLFLMSLAMLAFPGRACASEPLFASEPLDDEELAAARGGFTLPGGIEVGFGADIATSIGGDLLLKTSMRITDQGPVYSFQKADGTPISIEGGTIAPGIGDIVVAPTEGSVKVSVSVEMADLFVRHTVGDTISSIIANTASGVDIDHKVTIDLKLDNVSPFALGSAGFQIEGMGVDAASFRAP